MKNLDHSAQIQVLKGITKVSGNPLRIRQITRLPEKVSPPDRGGES